MRMRQGKDVVAVGCTKYVWCRVVRQRHMSYCSPPRRPSDFHKILALGSHQWAHGVVVSHPLRMREALGSIPSVSRLCTDTQRELCKESSTS